MPLGFPLDDHHLFPLLNGVLVGYALLVFLPGWRHTPSLTLFVAFAYSAMYTALIGRRLDNATNAGGTTFYVSPRDVLVSRRLSCDTEKLRVAAARLWIHANFRYNLLAPYDRLASHAGTPLPPLDFATLDGVAGLFADRGILFAGIGRAYCRW